MIVKCNDVKKFQKLNSWFDVPINKLEFEVLAIIKHSKITKYLFLIEKSVLHTNESVPYWFDSQYFEVLDENMPKNWVENKYKRFFELKNNKYDFSIPIQTYIGPPEFIEDNDFLFDIYDNPSKANEFITKFVEKYK